MTDLAINLDPTSPMMGDLLLTEGELTLAPDALTEVRQSIRQALSTYLGEWFMDVKIGVDYFGKILVKNPDMSVVNTILLNTILGVPGVIQVMTYKFTPEFATRKMTVTFTARTTSGIITYVG